MSAMEEFVQPVDILDSLKDEAFRCLAHYTVGFLWIENTSHGWDAALRGSGTLVAIGRRFAILTAHHVIQKLPRKGRLGVFLSPTHEPHSIDIDGLQYLEIARGNVDSVGPDLGAVLLAPSIASSIAAKKTFYNLEQQRAKLLHNPPDLRDGLWFVYGFLEEKTVVQPDEVSGHGLVKRFYCYGGLGRPQTSFQTGDHDYFTIPVSPLTQAPVPRNFGGMSGSGLWQIPLARDESGKLTCQTPLLSGVAFYQEAVTEAGSGLKCHGRLSVYRVAYDAIAKSSW
jgi:hypothetical protein